MQAAGLYGTNGIIPINETMSSTTHNFAELPTLFLFFHDDQALTTISTIGILASALAMLGIFTGPALFVAWLVYLSIVNAGDVFMSFQWDVLLLEVGFLSLFLATWKPFDLFYSEILQDLYESTPAFFESGRPSIVVIWLFRLLLFRFMISSGLVKIMSGDQTWADLTAMKFHYETQPLPTPIGYFAHHLPGWFQMFSTAGTFVIELIVPFMFFLPGKIRYVAGAVQIALQLFIIVTGNYCFFNLLTIGLCLFLFDDSAVNKIVSGRLESKLKNLFQSEFKPNRLRYIYLVPLVFLTVNMSLFMTPILRQLASSQPSFMLALVRCVYPFHLVNSYGLFAVMTTTRPEIVVEGSENGQDWKTYEFKYKVGPLNRPPPVIAPFQPRLDWQMWFAALGDDVYHSPWFARFCVKLLQGSSEVLSLMEDNPFKEKPPKFVRARLYDYKMTSFDELLNSGNWWRREYLHEFMPAISLEVHEHMD